MGFRGIDQPVGVKTPTNYARYASGQSSRAHNPIPFGFAGSTPALRYQSFNGVLSLTPQILLDLPHNQNYLSGMISDKDIERFETEGIVPPLVDIEHWLEKYDQQKTLVDKMHHKAMGRKVLKCPVCERGTQVNSITLTDVYRYSPSRSSYEDPEWYLTHSTFECPKCEAQLQLQGYDGSTKHSFQADEQLPLRKYFKEVLEDKNRERR